MLALNPLIMVYRSLSIIPWHRHNIILAHPTHQVIAYPSLYANARTAACSGQIPLLEPPSPPSEYCKALESHPRERHGIARLYHTVHRTHLVRFVADEGDDHAVEVEEEHEQVEAELDE